VGGNGYAHGISRVDGSTAVTWRVLLTFVALSVIWGIPYLLIKLAVAEIPPLDVAWGRLALGAVILLPVAWKRGALGTAAAHWRAVCAFALAELVVPFPLISLGERWISSSLTAILIATLPFIVILLAPLFGVRERPTVRRSSGLACGFVGVVVLLGIDPVHGLLAWAGVACVVVAVFGYASGSLIVQRHLHGVDEFGAVALSLAVATILLLPPTLMDRPAYMPSRLAIGSVIVLGAVCTATALWLYFYLVTKVGAARATVFTYVNPAIATLLGVFVLGEPLGVASIVGLALILLGLWVAARRT
jgi:drug/metabolite transporter (DMT)-like permease